MLEHKWLAYGSRELRRMVAMSRQRMMAAIDESSGTFEPCVVGSCYPLRMRDRVVTASERFEPAERIRWGVIGHSTSTKDSVPIMEEPCVQHC